MIYHILPEWEEFSAFRGGAVANIIANMMRFDPSSAVVCQAADGTLGYRPERLIVLAGMRRYHEFYARMSGKRLLFSPVYKPLLKKIFHPLTARLKPNDIVWCHSQVFVLGAIESEVHRRKAKLVYHAHSSLKQYAINPKFGLGSADAIVFVSEAIRQRALSLAPHLQKTYTLHNGVNHKMFFPADPSIFRDREEPEILFVGRLHPEKGIHVLIEALKILNSRGRRCSCRVVGSAFSGGSKPTPFMKSLVRSAPSNVRFLGYKVQTEIAEEYRKADILCCPSIFQDPFPGVPLEGMATGIPVVATRVGGIPEMARNGGFILVEPGSAPALADALDTLISDRDLRFKIGAAGLRSSRQNFGWEEIYENNNAFVKEILSSANCEAATHLGR